MFYCSSHSTFELDPAEANSLYLKSLLPYMRSTSNSWRRGGTSAIASASRCMQMQWPCANKPLAAGSSCRVAADGSTSGWSGVSFGALLSAIPAFHGEEWIDLRVFCHMLQPKNCVQWKCRKNSQGNVSICFNFQSLVAQDLCATEHNNAFFVLFSIYR